MASARILHWALYLLLFVVPILGHERGISASVIGSILGSFAIAAAVVGLDSRPPMTVSTPEPRRAGGRPLLAAMASQSATETPRCCFRFVFLSLWVF